MTEDTALSGSDNLHWVRVPGRKQGAEPGGREAGGWFSGGSLALDLGHLGC